MHPELLPDPDAQREADIKAALEACFAARDQGNRSEAGHQWVRACRLIEGRSKRKVEQMEKRMGLT